MRNAGSALLPSCNFSTVIFAAPILCILICSALVGPTALAQNGRPVLITQNVDESKLATLTGNTRPEANKQNDRGLVADNFSMEHMLLQLKRSPQQEQELLQYLEELQIPSSPNFHRWLTAKEYGERFGLATQDLGAIMRWLESHGFKVNVVYENGLLIDFSGTAGQVRAAFHTEIHQLDVKGEKHFANMSNPRIPIALTPAVVGVVSLHDFKPHTNYKLRSNYTAGDGEYLVVPGDLATIYNLNPLFTAGTSGQGQTIVVVEDSDVYSTADWTTFRSVFGLSSFTGGSFSQVHPAPPSGTNNCADPGINSDDGEAILDAEYASAAAPSAAIELAACNDTATFGGLIALQNLLNESSTPPAIVSVSYGDCEAFNGATSNAAFNSTFQQAVTEGVSVFVSSGDEGAASCSINTNESSDTYGIGVSGWASTPYNVAVGGTDFGDSYAGTNSTYWSATNSPTYESALSYIPEIPWNDSCGSLLGALYSGFSQTYGSTGFCNSSIGEQYLTTAAGSGGPSGCATGSPSTQGVVSGTCAGYAKPTWQSLVGNPHDAVRDLPDVSLFAGNGIWGHYYPFCYSDPDNGGTPCTGAPDTWAGAGGTSFSSPIMAGIQALVNQKTGERQGNPNTVYYNLAATEYGASGDTSCNSTLGNTVGSSCVFYDVTLGDMDVNCTGTENCYLPSGTNGVLSTSDGSYEPAYGTATGWDFATGIGSVNAYNLANAWPGSKTPSFTLSVNATPSSTPVNKNVVWSGTLTATNGYSNTVTLTCTTGAPSTCNISPSSIMPSSSGTAFTVTVGSGTAGTYSFNIQGTDGTITQTQAVSLTVTTPGFTLSAAPSTVALTPGAAGGTSTITVADVGGFTGNVGLAASGLPSGVTAIFNPTSTSSTSTLTLTASGSATPGPATVTITGTSGSITATTSVSLTVAQNFVLSTPTTPSPSTVPSGTGTTSTFNVTASNGRTFINPVTFACNGLPDATVSCGFSSIAQGASSPQQVTVTIQTTGPNTSGGVDQLRRRTDNRSPWLPLSLPLAGVVMLGFAGRKKISKRFAIVGLCVSLVAIGLLIACGGGGGGSSPVTVSVSQGTPSSIFPNDTADNWPAQSATFTATVSNTSNTAVTWTASVGTIASTGNDTATYTAPTIAAGLPSSATITATSASGPSGTATETLKAATVPGSYPLTVTATEGSISNTTSTITLTVR